VARQRLDVKQAARILNISSEGVRKRIKRDNLESEKGSDGRMYVWMDKDWTEDRAGSYTNGSEDLRVKLRDQVAYLRWQLEIWQEEARRKDHIIAALTERLPELDVSRETNEDRESCSR
jgi:hypothetical protein